MTIYYGVIRGNTVVLPEDIQMPEGAPVEVRLIRPDHSQPADEAAEERFRQLLRASGLVRNYRLPRPYSPDETRRLVPVEWKPLSEMIIEERHSS